MKKSDEHNATDRGFRRMRPAKRRKWVVLWSDSLDNTTGITVLARDVVVEGPRVIVADGVRIETAALITVTRLKGARAS